MVGSGVVLIGRGTSDTETLIELISLIGFQRALSEIRGMFAFGLMTAIANAHANQRLHGGKPLYFWHDKMN